MSERFEPRNTATPGPRTVVTLDVAEVGLAAMLEGVECSRVWLTEEDGTYRFHAVQPVGESKKVAGPLVSDLLVGMLNRIGTALEADDVPTHLRDLWDELIAEYNDRPIPAETPRHES